MAEQSRALSFRGTLCSADESYSLMLRLSFRGALFWRSLATAGTARQGRCAIPELCSDKISILLREISPELVREQGRLEMTVSA